MTTVTKSTKRISRTIGKYITTPDVGPQPQLRSLNSSLFTIVNRSLNALENLFTRKESKQSNLRSA